MTEPDTMPAGAEMDRLVAEKVMGWVRGGQAGARQGDAQATG